MVTAALFVVLNGLAALILTIESVPSAPEGRFAHALRLAYPDRSEEDLGMLQAESSPPFGASVFSQPREAPTDGKFVGVTTAGYRRGKSEQPWPPRDEDVVVFVFGGSTAFGYGVADEDTVPSYLGELLERTEGKRVAVYNFARGGYYSTQERVQFDHMLTLGIRPDLAVFIDGLNEFSLPNEPPLFTAYETKRAAEALERPVSAAVRGLPLFRWLMPTFEERRFADHVKQSASASSGSMTSPRTEEIIQRYISNKNVITALADAYGIIPAFVWQPIPVYRYDLEHHPAWVDLLGRRHENGYEQMRKVVARPEMQDLIWCADIQESLKEPLYVDHVHYNPRLSRLLAQCIAAGLRDSGALQRAESGRGASAFSRLEGRAE